MGEVARQSSFLAKLLDHKAPVAASLSTTISYHDPLPFAQWVQTHCPLFSNFSVPRSFYPRVVSSSPADLRLNFQAISSSSFRAQLTCHFIVNNPKMYMEPQKMSNCQSNLEKKEQNYRHHVPWLQTIRQRYSNQNSMGLAQSQTHRPVQQNRQPRNKPTHQWSVILWQNRQEYTMKKRKSLHQMMLGKLEQIHISE